MNHSVYREIFSKNIKTKFTHSLLLPKSLYTNNLQSELSNLFTFTSDSLFTFKNYIQ